MVVVDLQNYEGNHPAVPPAAERRPHPSSPKAGTEWIWTVYKKVLHSSHHGTPPRSEIALRRLTKLALGENDGGVPASREPAPRVVVAAGCDWSGLGGRVELDHKAPRKPWSGLRSRAGSCAAASLPQGGQVEFPQYEVKSSSDKSRNSIQILLTRAFAKVIAESLRDNQ